MFLINKFKIAFVLIFMAAALSCNKNGKFLSIKINKIMVTDAVPSGSGLAFYKNELFIVGDDAEFVAKFSLNNFTYTRSNLFVNAHHQRIEKTVKPDLEAAIIGGINDEVFLFAFGSGGVSPYRDTLFAMNMQRPDKNFKRSLLPLYNSIKKTAGLKETELNIEGASKAGNKLLLFNRGNNLVIIISWKGFTAYLKNEKAVPDLKVLKIPLPVINNFPIGISGACAINEQEILFTASLEETTDYINDGIIKGSYIGLLQIKNDTELYVVALTSLNDAAGKPIADKLESIEIIKRQGRNVEAVAVADNDDGKSKLFFLTLKLPE